jgi:hypothetical protein
MNVANIIQRITLSFSTISFLLITHFTAKAQKLPNKQEVSLRIPADMKIDGNAKEWNNKFQAYNKLTNIFYTLSNDDKNLYLVIQATDPIIIEKMIRGG